MSTGGKAFMAAAALLLLATTGCGRSTEELCSDFADECGDNNDPDDCARHADLAERDATEEGCLDLFNAYVDCIDSLDSLCNAAADCATNRQLLAQCGVFFE